MAGYRDEAADFLRRAASTLPALESDLELVCRLWAAADELDALVCDALTAFDDALFDAPGELDTTRGAEPAPPDAQAPYAGESLAYTCDWTIVRPESRRTSVALSADQLSGRLSLEVRDPTGRTQPIPFPLADPSQLYETLALAFFVLSGLSTS